MIKWTSENRTKIIMAIVAVIVFVLVIIKESGKSKSSTSASSSPSIVRRTIDALFSPHGGCTNRITREIDLAKVAIRVEANGFTSQGIADALIRAKERGVNVEILLDQKGEISQGEDLAGLGIPVMYDTKHLSFRNNVIIIDATLVLTGSFSFSDASESKNAENLVILNDPKIASDYLTNYKHHKSHSQPKVNKEPAKQVPKKK